MNDNAELLAMGYPHVVSPKGPWCAQCFQGWPCDVLRLMGKLRDARDRIEELSDPDLRDACGYDAGCVAGRVEMRRQRDALKAAVRRVAAERGVPVSRRERPPMVIDE